MRRTSRLLSLVLALLLAGSNMAFSAHVSSHSPIDSGLCSLCVHPGGPDTAISHKTGVYIFTLTVLTKATAHTPARFLPVISHVRQSRAPPCLI
jgi:hypothetical protein